MSGAYCVLHRSCIASVGEYLNFEDNIFNSVGEKNGPTWTTFLNAMAEVFPLLLQVDSLGAGKRQGPYTSLNGQSTQPRSLSSTDLDHNRCATRGGGFCVLYFRALWSVPGLQGRNKSCQEREQSNHQIEQLCERELPNSD